MAFQPALRQQGPLRQGSLRSELPKRSALRTVPCDRKKNDRGRRLRAATSLSPWKTLGLPEDADEKQIKQAYRKLALKHHPDVSEQGDDPALTGRFIEIQEAYEILVGKRRGKELDNHPFSAGSWDFHDWYWKFSMSRRQNARSPTAAASAAGAAPRQQVRSQLAGLRQKAAVRATAQRAAASSPPQAQQGESCGVRSARAWAREAQASGSETEHGDAPPAVSESAAPSAGSKQGAEDRGSEDQHATVVEERTSSPREYPSVVSFRPAQVEQPEPELAFAGARSGASAERPQSGAWQPSRAPAGSRGKQGRARLQHPSGSGGLGAMSPSDVLQCFRSVMGQIKARLEPFPGDGAAVQHTPAAASAAGVAVTEEQAGPEHSGMPSEAEPKPEEKPWWEEQVRGTEASCGAGRAGAGSEERSALQFQLAGLRRKASMKRSMEGC